MVRFLKKTVFFFALMAVIDLSCGLGFNMLKQHAKGGDTRKNYYIAEQSCDDILVLGSSRAARHYDPRVLEEASGLSCYNAGEPGCGVITAYARYRMVADRKTPKMVLYEVSPRFDYFKGEDNSKYLGRVRQYADKLPVKAMFLDLGDNLERLRLLSNMYKNNSFIVHNVIDNLSGSKDNKGFKPLKGVMKADGIYKSKKKKEFEVDSVKLAYMEKLIDELIEKDVKVCFLVSPKGISKEDAANEESEYAPIVDLCRKYNVPFINHTFMDRISDHREYFHDFVHFNYEGAGVYTKVISEELKQRSLWSECQKRLRNDERRRMLPTR